MNFKNPILQSGADPWVTYKEGNYFYTQTNYPKNFISIRCVKDLSKLSEAEDKIVWQPKPGQSYSELLWAPELHFLLDPASGKERPFIYFTGCRKKNESHRMFVLRGTSEDPLGDYELLGKISTKKEDRWAIDGTILQHQGHNYFIWSGWEGTRNIAQNLYICRMRSPFEVEGERVLLSKPEFDWEFGELDGKKIGVNEGPAVLSNKGKHFVAYSANGSWSDDYCLGLLCFNGGDILDVKNWSKEPAPLFTSHVTDNLEQSVFAPGHCSFTRSADGFTDLVCYHAAVEKGSGWRRDIHIQPFTFSESGKPSFGAPALRQN